MIVDVPEPFRSALRTCRPAAVCNAAAPSAEALFGRAVARLRVGRLDHAAHDLAEAEPELGNACGIELAYIDARRRCRLDAALATAKRVVREDAGTELGARALLVQGLALTRLRCPHEARDALEDGRRAFERVGEPGGVAEIQDALAVVRAMLGEFTDAYVTLDRSERIKRSLGDDYGLACTTVYKGRVVLDLEDGRAALELLEAGHAALEALGDRRTCARVHEDLARCHRRLGHLRDAERHLQRSIDIARREGFTGVLLFAYRGLARLRLEERRLDDAEDALERAEALLDERDAFDTHASVELVRGQLLFEREDPRSIDAYRAVLERVGEESLPALEIAAQRGLALALKRFEEGDEAVDLLARAHRRALSLGLRRSAREVESVMAELELRERPQGDGPRLHFERDDRPRVDGYRILERCGGGAFGEVYRAYDTLERCWVALKIVRAANEFAPERRARLRASARRELRVAAEIGSPNVARVLRLGETERGEVYVVSEWIPGVDLRRFMELHPDPDPALALEVLAKLALTLQACHRCGVLHHDVKPSNVMMREPGVSPVLIDFGVARLRGLDGPDADARVEGSIPFVSPERLSRAREVDGRSDVYALGVIAHRWLTGRLPVPVEGMSVREQLTACAERVPAPLAELRPDLPERVTIVLDKLLAHEPGDRPHAQQAVTLVGWLLGTLEGTDRAIRGRRRRGARHRAEETTP